MVKQRMTALDVRATVEEMRAQLIGLRLLNIYNITSKMFLLKFGQGENKRNVLLENGIRLHLTELAREKPKVPSQFTLKLRKHIRAWRLDSITQLQHDRTVDLCFGVAGTEGCFHIIVELFSKGNVILTDHAYRMMMLLRTHRDEEGLNLVVHETYPVTAPFTVGVDGSGGLARGDTPAASSVSAAAAAVGTTEEPHVMLYPPHIDAAGRLHVHRMTDADLTPAQQQLKAERTRTLKAEWDLGLSRSNDKTFLQSLVAGIEHFGPDLAQHVLTVTGVPNAAQKNWKESPDAVFDKVLPGLLEAYDLAKVDLTSAGGYLIKKTAGKGKAKHDAAVPPAASVGPAATALAPAVAPSAAVTVAVAEEYESFTPILLAQYTQDGVEALYHASFGRVCDDFFLITETERIDASNEKRKSVAKSKEAKFAADHARRIHGLEADIAMMQRKGAQLILNAEKVDEAIQLINGALATGIAWDALRSLLKRRNAEGHPVAYMIHELFLERNAISVLLESTLEDEEEDCEVPPLVVEVNLSKTAQANAADYFAKQKQSKSKLERTVASTDKAAAGAARKGARQAAEQKERKVIVKERQRNWWEKFFWFRTSVGDLVLRGKDVQSTELLLRRVKALGDFFVQCEVDGSLPCLLRPLSQLWWQDSHRSSSGNDGGESSSGEQAGNASSSFSSPAQPIAAASLCEAGAWCVAFSGAWESKQTTGAWWIYASQVTGGSAAGMYIFSGDRHYLPPQPMSLGCALLFYVTRTVDQPAAIAPADSEAARDEKAEEETEAGEQPAPEPSREEVLLQELPRLLSKAQLKAAATDVTDLDTSAGDVVPADSATALADMPTIEALRADQRKQQQAYRGHGHHHHTSGNNSNTKIGGGGNSIPKGKKGGNYARNSRVDRDALQGGGSASGNVGVSVVAEAEAVADTRTAANTNTQQQQQQQGKSLSKHQKKKLKKIQDKYGDQDEEDRVLGAKVNGNQLSRVQLLELERLAAARQQEEAERRRHEKTSCKAARDAGSLRCRNVEDAAVKVGTPIQEEEEEEENEVEEVSDFTDNDNVDDVDNGLAGDSEKEEPATAVASPTDPMPGEGHANYKDGDEEDDDGGSGSQVRQASPSATTTATTTVKNDDHNAMVVQQTAELHRVFPHYTMRPSPSDVVQHVVAVCAPMMVVNDYAYHTALAMGNAKKGALAGKLLHVFTERAERGGAAAAAGAGAGAGVRRKGQKKTTKAHADPSKLAAEPDDGTAAAVNPSVVKALQMMSSNDIVEQLRANVKPVDFKI